MKTLILFLALALVSGCASRKSVLVSTGTIIGVEIAQNPGTGLYQAKMGYNRAELAVVPTEDKYVPDVLTEIHFKGMFSKEGGIYQRLAVGPNAVTQPGAMAMFLRDSSGNVDKEALKALQTAFDTVPDAPVESVREKRYNLSLMYKVAPDKPAWDAATVEAGFTSFTTFLILPTATLADCIKVETALRTKGLIK